MILSWGKQSPLRNELHWLCGVFEQENLFVYKVSKTFSIGKSTAVTITCEFCMEIFRLSQFIMFPIPQLEGVKAIKNFKQDCDCKIPKALGAIDGSQIFIKTPENEWKYDYYWCKEHYSINTQYINSCRG